MHAFVARVVSEDLFVCLPWLLGELRLEGNLIRVLLPVVQVLPHMLKALDGLLQVILGTLPCLRCGRACLDGRDIHFAYQVMEIKRRDLLWLVSGTLLCKAGSSWYGICTR